MNFRREVRADDLGHVKSQNWMRSTSEWLLKEKNLRFKEENLGLCLSAYQHLKKSRKNQQHLGNVSKKSKLWHYENVSRRRQWPVMFKVLKKLRKVIEKSFLDSATWKLLMALKSFGGGMGYLWMKHKRGENWDKYRQLFQEAVCECVWGGADKWRMWGQGRIFFSSKDGRPTWYFLFSFPSLLILNHPQVLFILSHKLLNSIHFSPSALPWPYLSYHYPTQTAAVGVITDPLPSLLPSFNLFFTLQPDISQMQI